MIKLILSLSTISLLLTSSMNPYTADHHYVYYQGHIIHGADPYSYSIVDLEQSICKDAEAVYYKTIKLSDDPEHFEIIRGPYAKDRSKVYYLGKGLKVESTSLHVIPDSLQSDSVAFELKLSL